jgi:hypothetical protein
VHEGNAMYHTVEFAQEMMVDLEISPMHWLEQMLIRRGTRLQAQVKPYVVETADGFVEVADLFLEDGTTTRMVPFESFSFVD